MYCEELERGRGALMWQSPFNVKIPLKLSRALESSLTSMSHVQLHLVCWFASNLFVFCLSDDTIVFLTTI